MKAVISVVLMLVLTSCVSMGSQLSPEQMAAVARDNKTVTNCTKIKTMLWEVINVFTSDDKTGKASRAGVDGNDCSTAVEQAGQ
jgi:hypothetical protein